jgi:hypothetical protein
MHKYTSELRADELGISYVGFAASFLTFTAASKLSAMASRARILHLLSKYWKVIVIQTKLLLSSQLLLLLLLLMLRFFINTELLLVLRWHGCRKRDNKSCANFSNFPPGYNRAFIFYSYRNMDLII